MSKESDKEFAERLGRKLAVLIRLLVEHRDTRPRQPPAPGEPKLTSAKVQADLLLNQMRAYTTEDWIQRKLEKLHRDPVEYLLIVEIREIGWRAHERGGRDMMWAVEAAMVEASEDRIGAYGSGIINARWDGIGPWLA